MASKISIIIQREYLSRVRKKMFLITTLGLPILLAGLTFLMGYVASKTKEKVKIAVVDESKIFENKLWDSSSTRTFQYFAVSELPALQKNYLDKDFSMLLHVGKPTGTNIFDTQNVKIYSKTNLSLSSADYINDRLNEIYREQIMVDAGMNTKQIDSLNNVSVSYQNINENKSNTASQVLAGIGYFNGFLLYMLMFIYGMMVMRGVMEEKTNRVAEVIISSVKPFDLMMGKIIGIGLVGITQFVIWILFIVALSSVGASVMGSSEMIGAGMPMNAEAAQLAAQGAQKNGFAQMMSSLQGVNWLKIGLCFIIYFVGGFLLYAAQFAAVGSMVNEDVNEAQSLTLPITMPIIFGFVIMQMAIADPNSGMAVFGSIFPLTSPLVMMARIAYNPPMWQVILSIVLLFASVWFFVWLSAKIYRTGILMYGKKPTWKEVWKWLRVKA
jgi:ABC-2 type transport system permease protein